MPRQRYRMARFSFVARSTCIASAKRNTSHRVTEDTEKKTRLFLLCVLCDSVVNPSRAKPMKRLALLALLVASTPAIAQREYGFDNTKPSGQPYLKPEESLTRMKVADGFEIKLFAAEPMVVNPIAFTIDEK